MKQLNKKGDVPVMILVIGVVVICILTIFSFVAFKKSTGNGFEKGLYLFEQAQADFEMFQFYNSPEIGYSNKKIESLISGLDADKKIIRKEGGGVTIEYHFP